MKIVIIGGFASGSKALKYVKNEMKKADNDLDITTFRFSSALKNPGKVISAAKGAVVITQSAGCMALSANMRPKSVYVLAPLQSKRRHLYAIRALQGAVSHSFGGATRQSRSLVISKTLEFFRAPWGNYKWLINKSLSHYDFVKEIRTYPYIGSTQILLHEEDELLRLHEYDLEAIRSTGAAVHVIEGTHDDLYINPSRYTPPIKH